MVTGVIVDDICGSLAKNADLRCIGFDLGLRFAFVVKEKGGAQGNGNMLQYSHVNS